MTTVSEVITRAAEIVAEANEGRPAPEAYFAAQIALPRYNSMVRSWFGHGVGLPLQRVWTAAAGDRAVNGGLYAVSVLLPEYPDDGHRVGVTSAQTLTASTYTGTISGTSLLLTSGASSFFFRADTSDWELERDLLDSDTIYFPQDIVDGLPALLALKVLPTGYPGSDLLNAWGQVARQKIEQRYAPRLIGAIDPGLQARVWNGGFFNINTGQ